MANGSTTRSGMAGKAQTVLGPVTPEDLGITITHEHLLADLRVPLGEYEPTDPGEKELALQPVAMENLWWIRHNVASSRDNVVLDDEPTAIEEVTFYRNAGGGTIVDATNDCFGREPLALVRISQATGLHLIMGSGYYLATTHPADMDRKTEGDICREIVADVTKGVAGTGIRAGLIGEIGCSWPMADNERKALRAAAAAQELTGAPLSVHPGRKPEPDASDCLEIAEIVDAAGGDLGRTIMCHIDRTLRSRKERREVAATGCYLEYDIFGWEGYHSIPTIDLPNDNQRINEIMQLIDDGYLNRILVAQDIAWKSSLRRYGGIGYDHILRNVVPLMRAKGMSAEQIDAILVQNPKRLLPFA